MTTDKTPATLATVKHGGCVQLGDGLLPCPFCGNGAEFVPYKNNGLTLKCKSMGCIQRHQRTLRYGIEWLRTSMTEQWNTRALSAQPSPGGQGDEWDVAAEAAWNTLQESGYLFSGEPFDDAHEDDQAVMRRVVAAVLAARQPVGMTEGAMRAAASRQTASAESNATAEALITWARQPMGQVIEYQTYQGYGGGRWDKCDKKHYDNGKAFEAKYGAGQMSLYRTLVVGDAAPPAQAVDLPYSIDADPAGIHACVADVITGTLMVGAQGHTTPPAGHWAEPFWQAARADALVQEKTQAALQAAAKSLRTIANSTKDTEFLETASEIRAYANSRANCAEQALTDSLVVGNG